MPRRVQIVNPSKRLKPQVYSRICRDQHILGDIRSYITDRNGKIVGYKLGCGSSVTISQWYRMNNMQDDY